MFKTTGTLDTGGRASMLPSWYVNAEQAANERRLVADAGFVEDALQLGPERIDADG